MIFAGQAPDSSGFFWPGGPAGPKAQQAASMPSVVTIGTGSRSMLVLGWEMMTGTFPGLGRACTPLPLEEKFNRARRTAGSRGRRVG
jgi:hypothetical protein